MQKLKHIIEKCIIGLSYNLQGLSCGPQLYLLYVCIRLFVKDIRQVCSGGRFNPLSLVSYMTLSSGWAETWLTLNHDETQIIWLGTRQLTLVKRYLVNTAVGCDPSFNNGVQSQLHSRFSAKYFRPCYKCIPLLLLLTAAALADNGWSWGAYVYMHALVATWTIATVFWLVYAST